MLTLNGPASGAASLVKTHRKRVMAADIAAWSETHSFALARQGAAYSTNGSGSAIASLIGIGGKGGFANATGGRQPLWEYDDDLGRPTARFAADFSSYMTGLPMVYTGPFTLAVVFKATINPAKTNQCIIGAYGASAPERAFLNLTAGGKVQSFYGDDGAPSIAYPGDTYAGDRWALGIMSYDGATYLKCRVNGGAVQIGDAIDTEPASTTALGLGFNGSVGQSTFAGLMDSPLVLTTDLLANTNAAKLADYEAFLRGYYGAALSL